MPGVSWRPPQDPFVRKLAGVADLSEADLAILSRLTMRSRDVEAQTTLLQSGDRPNAVFVILEGCAGCFRNGNDGRRQILGYLLPGDFCDPDLAGGGRFDYSIGTLTACRVARLAAQDFGPLLAAHPAIARALRIGKLITEATWREWLISLGRRTAVQGTAHLLCEMLVRLQDVGLASADSCELPLNQTDLADTLGLSNVHMNRTLQALRSQGLIELRDRRLAVKDVPRLHRLADFSPAYLRSAFGAGVNGRADP